MYEILISERAKRELSKLNAKEKRVVAEKIEFLKDNPEGKGTQKIQNKEKLRRIKAGNKRIIYRLLTCESLVEVLKIQHRDKVYREYN